LIGKSIASSAIGGALDRVGPVMLTRHAIEGLKTGSTARAC